ncbi:MAG: hypothetical protein SWK76_10205 [Actinomycetota bacterium]|nr:hypothetical protein [Actinomycetota bacterium]
MKANDWWKTFSLFLWFYNTAAAGVVLVYFYGVCRMAERRFEGRTYAGLLVVFFFLMGGSTLVFSMSSSIVAIDIWFAIWPALAGIVLCFVVFRAYRIMMG